MENNDIQENQEEDFSEATVPLQKQKKEKKPRTQKQLEHFEKMAENIEKKKLEKKIEASKLLLEHDAHLPKANEQRAEPSNKQPVKESSKNLLKKK